MDFEIYYLTLYLSDTNEYEKRLQRAGKAVVKYSKFDKNNSENQQNEYLKLSEEIKREYPQLHVVNIDSCKDLENVENEIKEILS